MTTGPKPRIYVTLRFVDLRKIATSQATAVGTAFDVTGDWTAASGTLAVLLRGEGPVDRPPHLSLERVSHCHPAPVSMAPEDQLLLRIGADLHDGPAQLIALALMQLGAATPADASHGTNTATAIGLLQQALAGVRHIAFDLSAPGLETFTVAGAVDAAIARHEHHTDLCVGRDLAATPIAGPAGLAACVFRVVQEGLRNAHRHAAGSDVCVTTAETRDVEGAATGRHFTVEIADRGDGSGEIGEHGAAGPHSGLGLIGLRRRVEALGGTINIEFVSGRGTRLLACFPLHHGNSSDV